MNQVSPLDGWHVLQLGLSIGASAAAVVGATWGLWRLGKGWWDRTIGRRRAQASILNGLACGMSLDYAETKLGIPQFITRPYQACAAEERIYRLPGAWVCIQAKGGAISLLSITITDSKMWYATGGITLGVIDLELGKDTFVKAPESDSVELWYGAHNAGYIRHYYGANPGGYQDYWLSHNEVGAGELNVSAENYATGIFGDTGGTPPNTSSITANTLTVLAPDGNKDDFKDRLVFGPHIEQLRLLWSERSKLH